MASPGKGFTQYMSVPSPFVECRTVLRSMASEVPMLMAMEVDNGK